MSDATVPSPALARIDAALARIDAVTKAQQAATTALSQRHGALRARMTEAVEALDAMIAREGGKTGGAA